MKKSLIALLLVVALVVTVSVFAASAETTNPFQDQTGEVKAYCRACESEQTWYPVNKDEFEAGTAIASWATVTQNEAATHFYFPEGMKMGAAQTLTAGKYCFDLNGKTITRSASKTFVLKGADLETAPELNLFDSSVGESGTLHVTTVSSYCFRLEGSGILNIYGGNYICAGIKDANGAKPASGSSQTGVGIYATADAKGEVNLYGGTLTGRSRMSGGLMYAAGPVVFTVDGADLEGWTGGSTGGVVRLNHTNAKLIMKSGSITGHAEKQVSGDSGAVTDTKKAMSSTVKLQNYADFEMTGGTITGESKQGGALYMSSGTAKISGGELIGTAYDAGGAIYKCGGTLTISGGKISGTATKGGGAICNTTNNMTISGGEVTGTSGSGYSGGALRITGGDVNITDGKIYDGSATRSNGGNIYWSSDGKLSISGGEITGGSATRNTTENQYGRGGNIHFTNGTFEMTGGKVSGGKAYEGGNLSYISGDTVSITGGEITGGTASNYGGNIYSDPSNMTIDAAEGKSITISGGTAKAGGNIYIAGGTTATITGPNVTITKGSDGNKYNAGSATEQVGSQITVVGTAPAYEEDGTTVKTPANISTVSIKDVAITYRPTSPNLVHTTQFTLMDYAELEVDGDEKIDCVYFAGNMTGKVTVKEGFTGTLVTRWRDNNINKSFKQPGAVVPANLWQETGYVGGGDVYVVDNERSQLLTVDMGDAVEATAETEADNMFRVATVYGYKYDAEGNLTSKLLGHMPTAEEGYDFVRPYFYGTYTLAGDTTFDIPERNCKIITNGFNLKLIDRSTNEFDYEEGYVTVDDETKVSIKTQLANGNQYLVLADKAEGEATKFTAHRVKVDIDSVNIKPATAGIYYATNMDTTPEASQAAVSYGVVLSLVDMPGADFVSDNVNGDDFNDNLYTENRFELGADERVAVQGANSALLVGILNQGAETNKAWGEYPIYANAYICFEINGEKVYFMADKTYGLSLRDIMELVDGNEDLASHPSVVKMYDTWQDPLAQWGLTNIEAAYNAAKA